MTESRTKALSSLNSSVTKWTPAELSVLTTHFATNSADDLDELVVKLKNNRTVKACLMKLHQVYHNYSARVASQKFPNIDIEDLKTRVALFNA